VISKEEPPEEKNGNGIPVAGNKRTTTLQFKSDCKRITTVQPKASKDRNLSLHFILTRKPLQANKPSRQI